MLLPGAGLVSGLGLWGAGLVALPSRELLAALFGLAVLGSAYAMLAPMCACLWRTLRRDGVRFEPCADARRRGTGLSMILGVVTLGSLAHFFSIFLPVPDGELRVDAWTPIASTGARPIEAPATLRIVTFNVLHGYPRFRDQEERVERTIRALRTLDADVLVLQEAWHTRDHGGFSKRLAEELGMHFVYARANGSKRFLGFEEGSAILSRYPILRARRVAFEARRFILERRIALVATIGVPGAEPLTIVGTHFSHGRDGAVAVAQARELLGDIDEAAIVAGDLNARSDSEAVRAFTSEGWRDLVPGGIDHILVRDDRLCDWFVTRAARIFEPHDLREILGEPARISDHPAYIVELGRLPVVAAVKTAP